MVSKQKAWSLWTLRMILTTAALVGIGLPEAWAQAGSATGFNLFGICITAFVAVFLLLTILAGVMQGIMSIFPGKDEPPPQMPRVSTAAAGTVTTDASRVVAITSALQARVPGARVTRIEEVR